MSAMSQNLLSPLRLAPSHTSNLQGFSLLEFVVVICLIGILLAVAIVRLVPFTVEAERVAVLTLEGQMRSTVMMAAAQRIARGESASIATLNGANPMDFMLEVPGNYIGELNSAGLATDSSGHWFFDVKKRRLVYRPRQGFTFRSAEDPVKQLEFEVRVAFADRDANGTFEPGTDELYGVRLLRAAGDEWLNTGERAYP
jgi:prepilin-type N-terminal cleavage/methylation domain-containing protein